MSTIYGFPKDYLYGQQGCLGVLKIASLLGVRILRVDRMLID